MPRQREEPLIELLQRPANSVPRLLGSLADHSAWKAERLAFGAKYDEPFLASLIPGRAVKPFSRHTFRKRFRTASNPEPRPA